MQNLWQQGMILTCIELPMNASLPVLSSSERDASRKSHAD